MHMTFTIKRFIWLQSFRGSVDPFHVNAVDTTGAGDSYVGALLCNIVDDRSVLEVQKYKQPNIIWSV